jgi:tetraacyldisaccharide-1-P 4'-kinase
MLCTEKDIFNLRNVQLPSVPVYCARISMEISEPDKLWRAILETAERHLQREND